MEKHVTVQNLVSGDSFEVVAKKDADGNALLTPTNEGTYSLKDYFDVHITRNGADRTAYYNFVDSLTAENPETRYRRWNIDHPRNSRVQCHLPP